MYPDEEQLRIPPHSVDAEQSVLGGLMLDNRAWGLVSGVINEDDFYRKDHKFIFQSIAALSSEDKPLDWITLSNWLKDRGELETAGGTSYLGTLAKDTPSAANIRAYAELVKEKSILRQLIGLGVDIQTSAIVSDGIPAKEKALAAQDSLVQLVQDNRDNKSVLIRPKQMAKTMLEKWHRVNNGDSLMGLKTGFSHLDKITQGLGDGWLVVIAGRPKMGKTAFAMALEQSILSQGKPVGIISMEMPQGELMERHLSRLSDIPLSAIRSGNIVKNKSLLEKSTPAIGKFKDFKYFVDDSGGLTPQEIRDSVTNMNNESMKEYGEPLAAVVVDYIQIMRPEGKSRGLTEDVTEFSSQLKKLAKDFRLPVIALSQLNRELEKRPNKRPVMSDLRNSGAIEQDADLILFLYRDEVYDKDSKFKECGEIIIGAFRHGQTDTVMAGWKGECTKWYDKAQEFDDFE